MYCIYIKIQFNFDLYLILKYPIYENAHSNLNGISVEN